MEHDWKLSWPGNYCLKCGMDDPLEAALCCPDCKFEGGPYGLDNWTPCEAHKPQPCKGGH